MKIWLSPEEEKLCREYALARWTPKRAAGVPDHKVGGHAGMDGELIGTRSEKAVSKAFGWPMHQLPGLRTDRGRPDFCGNVYVKGMFAGGRHLIIPQKDYPLPDDALIVLCEPYSLHVIEILGWVTGADFRLGHQERDLGYGPSRVFEARRLSRMWGQFLSLVKPA